MPTLDIAVSVYKEKVTATAEGLQYLRDLPCSQGIDIRTIIYTKGGDANLPSVYYATNASKIIQLPNAGGEGGTYLSHILLVWNDLARHTIFSHRPAPHRTSNGRQHIFNTHTSVLPLDAVAICECRSCTDAWDS